MRRVGRGHEGEIRNDEQGLDNCWGSLDEVPVGTCWTGISRCLRRGRMVAEKTAGAERRMKFVLGLDSFGRRGLRGESVDLNCYISRVYVKCSSSRVKGVVILYIGFNDNYNK